MKIIECVQYSPDWWEARRGIPTASSFDKIMTPKTMKLSESCMDYIYQLIADSIHFDPNMLTERPMTAAMRNGSECEPEARNYYAFDREMKVQQVGFCLSDDGKFGCSPDGLVGDAGLLELKCPQPHTHVKYLHLGELPNEYKAQVHGQLIVTGREWCDFMSYCPGFDPFIVRVTPDPFTETLRAVLDMFWQRFQEIKAKVMKKAA